MTLKTFRELQSIHFATLELIIHGQPKDSELDGDCWRDAVHVVLTEFSTFIRTHDPRQTPPALTSNDLDRGAN